MSSAGHRESEAWAAYTRVTRIMQAGVAAIVLALLAGLWDPENPALAVVCGIPCLSVVFIVGYLRGLRTELPEDRATFLAPEEITAVEASGKKGERRRWGRPRIDLPDVNLPSGAQDTVLYTRALLTLLVLGPRKSVTVRTTRRPPDLTEFAGDPDDVMWVSNLPFQYEHVSTDFLIGYLVGLAKAPSPDEPSIHAVLRAEMSSGEAVTFALTVTGAEGAREMVIEYPAA